MSNHQFSNTSKFTSVALLLLLLAPAFVSATHLPDNEGHLVPQCRSIVICQNADGSKVEATNVCTACDIFALANSIMRFLWWNISLPIAILMFAYAGFLMVVPGGSGEGSSARYTKGKKVLTTTVVGIAIVFFSWLLIDTGIKALSPGGLTRDYGFWNKIDCSMPAPSSATPPRCPSYEDTNFEAEEEGVTGTVYTNEQARSALSTAGITITSTGDCQDRSVSTCTSLEGIHQRTITTLVALRAACTRTRGAACPVTVTGGTETGHSTEGDLRHDTGNKIDIATTPEISAYFKSSFHKLEAPREDGADVYIDRGGWYEGSLALALEYKKNRQGQFIDAEGHPTTDRNQFVPDHWDIGVQ